MRSWLLPAQGQGRPQPSSSLAAAFASMLIACVWGRRHTHFKKQNVHLLHPPTTTRPPKEFSKSCKLENNLKSDYQGKAACISVYIMPLLSGRRFGCPLAYQPVERMPWAPCQPHATWRQPRDALASTMDVLGNDLPVTYTSGTSSLGRRRAKRSKTRDSSPGAPSMGMGWAWPHYYTTLPDALRQGEKDSRLPSVRRRSTFSNA